MLTKNLARLLAGLLVFWALPALAQTDDRISNDALQLLAGDKVVSEIGALCVADTGDDPAVAAAFAGWQERNNAWRIVGVATLGTRGVAYSEASMVKAQDKVRVLFMPLYETSEDKPGWCRRMALDIDSAKLDAGLMFPEAATRIEEARQGKWPVLDVAKSFEVYTAERVKQRFFEIQFLMSKCAETFGDPRGLFADAHPYWAMENVAALRRADEVIQGWGALAPERDVQVRAFAQNRVDILFYDEEEARARCAEFVGGLEDGKEDLAVTDAAMLSNLERFAASIPGAE